MTLTELNYAVAAAAESALLACCGSRRWAKHMTARRPFAAVPDVLKAADDVADQLTEVDWLEAFAAHPRIGERGASSWSQSEQAAALEAEESVQIALARANQAYEEKFGFIFIVFASGKTPAQILELMANRSNNRRDREIRNAAAEQRKITRARLLKLLGL